MSSKSKRKKIKTSLFFNLPTDCHNFIFEWLTSLEIITKIRHLSKYFKRLTDVDHFIFKINLKRKLRDNQSLYVDLHHKFPFKYKSLEFQLGYRSFLKFWKITRLIKGILSQKIVKKDDTIFCCSKGCTFSAYCIEFMNKDLISSCNGCNKLFCTKCLKRGNLCYSFQELCYSCYKKEAVCEGCDKEFCGCLTWYEMESDCDPVYYYASCLYCFQSFCRGCKDRGLYCACGTIVCIDCAEGQGHLEGWFYICDSCGENMCKKCSKTHHCVY